jgi:hypothetical protein
MLENIICPYTKYAFVYIMKRMTVALMKNANGNYVIEKCVKVFPPELQIVSNTTFESCVVLLFDHLNCHYKSLSLKITTLSETQTNS